MLKCKHRKIRISLVNSKKRPFVFLVYIGETISRTHIHIVCNVSVNTAYLHNNINIIFKTNVNFKIKYSLEFCEFIIQISRMSTSRWSISRYKIMDTLIELVLSKFISNSSFRSWEKI